MAAMMAPCSLLPAASEVFVALLTSSTTITSHSVSAWQASRQLSHGACTRHVFQMAHYFRKTSTTLSRSCQKDVALQAASNGAKGYCRLLMMIPAGQACFAEKAGPHAGLEDGGLEQRPKPV